MVGSSDRIPLPDSSADAVLIAQAFHWMDEASAYLEIERVLRPSGVMAMVWNHRDHSYPWIRELGMLWGASAASVGAEFDHTVPDSDRFDQRAELVADWAQPMNVHQLVALTETRSYVIALPAKARAALIETVRDLAASHPDLAGRTTFDLHYRTHAYRMVRRST